MPTIFRPIALLARVAEEEKVRLLGSQSDMRDAPMRTNYWDRTLAPALQHPTQRGLVRHAELEVTVAQVTAHRGG